MTRQPFRWLVARPRRLFALAITRRIWPFMVVYSGIYVVAAFAFWYTDVAADGTHLVSLYNSFYWCIVTLGTVGYGDIVPTTTQAKNVTMIVIVTQIFLLGFLISAVVSTVTEQAQQQSLGLYGTTLHDHFVVIGYTPVGAAAVRELLVKGQKVVVVTDKADDVPKIRALGPEDRVFATYGTLTEPSILQRVNLRAANGVIIAADDDSTNMIVALNVRGLLPNARTVVSLFRSELRDTFRAAGVTYVACPTGMGGRLCAAAAYEPEVAHAIDVLARGDVDSDIQEYLIRKDSPIVGKTFTEADALTRAATGCLLIGLARRRPDGVYETLVNPPFDSSFAEDDAVLIVGTLANVKRFRHWFGSDQGR